MERLLFDCVEEVGGKRMKFPTHPSSKWDFSSEWFYTSFSELTKDNQNVDVKRQEKKISIKNSKNLYDNLSSNTLFEFENKKQHRNKIIKSFLIKKDIK